MVGPEQISFMTFGTTLSALLSEMTISLDYASRERNLSNSIESASVSLRRSSSPMHINVTWINRGTIEATGMPDPRRYDFTNLNAQHIESNHYSKGRLGNNENLASNLLSEAATVLASGFHTLPGEVPHLNLPCMADF